VLPRRPLPQLVIAPTYECFHEYCRSRGLQWHGIDADATFVRDVYDLRGRHGPEPELQKRLVVLQYPSGMAGTFLQDYVRQLKAGEVPF
jgi:hypothetical protein